MTITKIATSIVGLAGAVGVALASVNHFQSAESAGIEHESINARFDALAETMASDREIGDLRTRKELLEVKIQRLKDLADERPLTGSEVIDLRSLEKELEIVRKRLTDLGKG